MAFLPEDYESPKTNSQYLKLQDGENRIRILTSPILGWEDWEDRKPIRFRFDAKPTRSVDPKKPVKHFWAFIVWDYNQSRICIFQVTQATIRKRLENLAKDSDWGEPFYYDVKIIKSGQAVDTEYEVNPASPKEIDPKIKEEFEKTPVDLEALFDNYDPFEFKGFKTLGFWQVDTSKETDLISKDQLFKLENEINLWIVKHDPEFKQRALQAHKITDFSQLKRKYFDSVMKRIEEKKSTFIDNEIPF